MLKLYFLTGRDCRSIVTQESIIFPLVRTLRTRNYTIPTFKIG